MYIIQCLNSASKILLYILSPNLSTYCLLKYLVLLLLKDKANSICKIL